MESRKLSTVLLLECVCVCVCVCVGGGGGGGGGGWIVGRPEMGPITSLIPRLSTLQYAILQAIKTGGVHVEVLGMRLPGHTWQHFRSEKRLEG